MNNMSSQSNVTIEELVVECDKLIDTAGWEEAMQFLKKVGDDGNPDGYALLGSYQLGNNSFDEMELSKSWSRIAAEQGSALGTYNYAFALQVWDENAEDAKRWFETAAQLGYAEAYVRLGEIHESTDIEKAIELYKSALIESSPYVFFKLGEMYSLQEENGLANVWYKKSAEAGYVDAMKKLAEICEDSGDLKAVQYWHERIVESEISGSTNAVSTKKSIDRKRPANRLIRNPREAEEIAAEWMKFFGFIDALPTPIGPDNGIDVVSTLAIAQVKMEGISTSRPTVQALAGVASVENKKALFFSLGGYTSEAIEWSEKAVVSLFQFDLQGEPFPMNSHARHIFNG